VLLACVALAAGPQIEIPGKGDDTRSWGPPFIGDESTYFMSVNRNKRSVALDIKSEGGREAIKAMVPHVDVLVENFIPGTWEDSSVCVCSVCVCERVHMFV
jgi:crotonobetainyl-CoA:carnitine CoA-transferase CaiB-like acyl-CoA transferase